MMNTTEISTMENKYEEFLLQCTKRSVDIVLYGGGAGADWAISLLETKDIRPKYIVDKFHGGGVKRNVPVISYEELVRTYENREVYILITSPRYEEEIYEQLQEYFDVKQIFSFECELYYHYIHDISAYRKYVSDRSAEFMKLYDKLGDDFSRRTLENVLKGRISAQLKYFREVYVENQYFAQDIITLGDHEVFVDIGAYIGDTVEEIVRITGGNYQKIYCFEPDKKCTKILKKNVQHYKNVEVVEKGAWDKHDFLCISEDSEHGASAIKETGEYEIELDCIDDCVSEKECITHIKMDIEGAELAALHGARKTIQAYRPKLAICVYYKDEDILDISDYILSIVPDYKLFLRHHNMSGTETVLYAICD